MSKTIGFNVSNKIVLIIGGASGLGIELVRECLRRGAKVSYSKLYFNQIYCITLGSWNGRYIRKGREKMANSITTRIWRVQNLLY